MRALYVFLFAIVLCQVAVGQTRQKSNSSSARYSSRYFEGTWFGKVNVLSLFDPQTPTLQLSLEYRINKRLSVEVTPGFPVYTFRELRSTDTTYNRYYKIKAGLKFFPGKHPRFYVGPEFFFTHRARSKFDGIVMGEDGKHYGYRYGELKKNIFGATLKFGLIAPISEKVNFEPAIAFGPRFVHLKLDATNLDQTSPPRIFAFNTDRIGGSLGMHVATEFKISYIIR